MVPNVTKTNKQANEAFFFLPENIFLTSPVLIEELFLER